MESLTTSRQLREGESASDRAPCLKALIWDDNRYIPIHPLFCSAGEIQQRGFVTVKEKKNNPAASSVKTVCM